MLFSILLNYLSGRLMGINKKNNKIILIITIILDLSILVYFKYSAFIVNNINSILHSNYTWSNVILPLGISFYTFQAMSYPIDVYRERVSIQKNILLFGTYISLFPQLIAGPIVRYSEIENQLGQYHYSSAQMAGGIQRFVIGLSKKVLIANNIGMIWQYYSSSLSNGISLVGSWLGMIAFTLQIYFDFSGYSDMAIGLGKMLGFEFPENFRFPYMSKTITEFWRRWHITLGSWFRDYVYIPLGGNRKGLARQLLNILVVWALTGLWHGASWNFVIWGLYYALMLVIEKLFVIKKQDKIPNIVLHVYTLLIVSFGWVIFQFTSLGELCLYIKSLFDFKNLFSSADIFMLSGNIILIIVAVFFSTDSIYKIFNRIPDNVKAAIKPIAMILLLLMCTMYLVNDSYNPFLYFRF